MATTTTTSPAPARERGCCVPLPQLLGEPETLELAGLLKAMADPTRLQILHCLRRSEQPVCVCDFTATFGLSQSTVSHHLAKLRAAGLVEVSREGVWSYWRLADHLSAPAQAAIAIVP